MVDKRLHTAAKDPDAIPPAGSGFDGQAFDALAAPERPERDGQDLTIGALDATDTLQAYLREQENAPLGAMELATAFSAVILLAAMVVAWIALLRFWRIAPWLYLATTVGGLVLVLATGPSVTTAIETLFDTASSTMGGAILAMAFFSSDLRAKFGFASAPPE